jgi:hypothetical protein
MKTGPSKMASLKKYAVEFKQLINLKSVHSAFYFNVSSGSFLI